MPHRHGSGFGRAWPCPGRCVVTPTTHPIHAAMACACMRRCASRVQLHRLAVVEVPLGALEAEALRVADESIAGVRERGDAYVREQIERFDQVKIDEILDADEPAV